MVCESTACNVHKRKCRICIVGKLMYNVLENDIVMSSLLFMLITYYSVLTDTNECD